MVIEILTVTPPQRNSKGGKNWNSIEVAYKKDGKIEGKKLVDFNNKDVFTLMLNSKIGEVYDVSTDKDSNGYWQWTGAVRQNSSASQNLPSATGGSSAGTPGQASEAVGTATDGQRPASRVTGSHYPTAEERETLGRRLTRQHAVDAAIALRAGDTAIPFDEVLKTAVKIAAFTLETRVQDLTDDVPF